MGQSSLVELKAVSYCYPTEQEPTLHKINLKFEPGKIYGIIGANDSGKTTLCNVIRGFCPSFYGGKLAGNVLFHDQPLQSFTTDLSRRIGYIFQDPFVQLSHEKATVYEEIAYGLENLGRPIDDICRRVEKVMTLLGIADLYDKNPLHLSGGQTQKVAIAAIMALDPELYIFDEPTSSLDPLATKDIFRIFQLLKNSGRTVIVTEHKTNLLAETADYLIAMKQGTIIESGTPVSVLNSSVVKEAGINLTAACQLSQVLKCPHKQFATIDEAVTELRGIKNDQ